MPSPSTGAHSPLSDPQSTALATKGSASEGARTCLSVRPSRMSPTASRRAAATAVAIISSRLDAAREAGRPPRRARPAATSPTPLPPARPSEKASSAGNKTLNLGIVTSYNDMLSAHQPYQFYPDIIKEAARAIGATAQVAGGVPAMCDGVTQGQPGMDLSPVQPRRHRHVDGHRAQPQHVRRRGLSRHLRQDRARPADRRADLRPPAGRLRARRPDALGHPQRREEPRSASSMPRARSAAPNCSKPRASPTTRPAPAPSTAPPTPTRC